MTSRSRRWWRKEERFREIHRKLRLNYVIAKRNAENLANARMERALERHVHRINSEREREAEMFRKVLQEFARIDFVSSRRDLSTELAVRVILSEQLIVRVADHRTLGPYLANQIGRAIEHEMLSKMRESA